MLLECYVLRAIDQLTDSQASTLKEMTPKLSALYQVQGEWHQILGVVMELPPNTPTLIKGLWVKNTEIARRNGVTLTPKQFAQMAGLTILSLGDSQEKRQKMTSEAVSSASNRPVPKVNGKNAAPGLPAITRYPERRARNFPFPVSELQPTEGAICEARTKDKADLQRLQEDIAALFEKAEYFQDQSAVEAGVVIEFLRYELSPLMQRAAEIGEPALREFRALEHIEDGLMNALLKLCPEGARSTPAA